MEKDIVYYTNLLKSNIKLVEDDKNNKEAIKEVHNSFIQVFEHIKVFLISKRERYYGYFLMNLKLEIDMYKDIVAGVSLDTEPFTLTINPLLLGKYKIKEIIYIICHEIEHIVLDHPSQGMKLNPSRLMEEHMKLNLAMDASVNDRLNFEVNSHSNIIATPNDLVDSKVFSEYFNLKNVRSMQDFLYYYRMIPKDKKNDSGNDIASRYSDGGNSKEVVTSKDSKGGCSHNWSDSDTSEDLKERTRDFVKRVVDGIPEESRGLFPAYQSEAISKILKPAEIRWEQVLKKYIGLIPIPFKKTKMRLNRRQPDRFDIPGRVNDRTIRLVVAIDTSGSMSNKMLEKVFIEIFEILRKSKFELTIIECDASIGRVYQASKLGDINLKVTGRGGTCFTPVIEYINKSGKYRDAVLVYFTDGYGEDEIPKPKTYRNLWVIIGDKNQLSVKKPYGEVLNIGYDYYNDF